MVPIHYSSTIKNVEELETLLVECQKESSKTHSKNKFILNNKTKRVTLEIISIGKVKFTKPL